MTKKIGKARSQESKEARKALILKAAREIVDKWGFPALTMDAVAKRSALAKGSLYNYFETREEMLLALLQQDFGQWFSSMEAYLAGSEEPFGPGFPEAWLQALEEQPRLATGMAYLHLLLEPNIGESFALRWKRFLHERTTALHYRLIQRFTPHVTAEEVVGLLIVFTGLSVGLWMQAQTSSQVQAVFASHPELRLLQADFPTHFRKAARALLESEEYRSMRALRAR